MVALKSSYIQKSKERKRTTRSNGCGRTKYNTTDCDWMIPLLSWRPRNQPVFYEINFKNDSVFNTSVLHVRTKF